MTELMSQLPETVDLAPISPAGTTPPAETPAAAHLRQLAPDLQLAPYLGARVPALFSTPDREIAALTGFAGIFDLGFRAFIRITGEDRVRWLNGMVTNTIQSLEEGRGNYSFLLNAQGRIQGDATVYRLADHLLLQTDRSQLPRIAAHLDHFIIMDDVELHLPEISTGLDAVRTAIGIAGPKAMEILRGLGAEVPGEHAFLETKLAGMDITLVHAPSPVVPRFEVWLAASSLPAVWTALTAAGAIPCGVQAMEALRILDGTPLFGTDIRDKHLAQETAQTRALNFNKGCYLGQEIVERIRSRATIHRSLRQFLLNGAVPLLEPGQLLKLNAEELSGEDAQKNPVGELSSVAPIQSPAFTGTLALGFIRTEALERKLTLTYPGGTATPLDTPPSLKD